VVLAPRAGDLARLLRAAAVLGVPGHAVTAGADETGDLVADLAVPAADAPGVAAALGVRGWPVEIEDRNSQLSPTGF
jgi:hypothetical protein